MGKLCFILVVLISILDVHAQEIGNSHAETIRFLTKNEIKYKDIMEGEVLKTTYFIYVQNELSSRVLYFRYFQNEYVCYKATIITSSENFEYYKNFLNKYYETGRKKYKWIDRDNMVEYMIEFKLYPNKKGSSLMYVHEDLYIPNFK